jgi:hypothetical protein
MGLAEDQASTPMTSGLRWNDCISGNLPSPSVAFRSLDSAAISHASKETLGRSSPRLFRTRGQPLGRSRRTGAIHSSFALGHDTRYFREPEKSGWQRTRTPFAAHSSP